MRERGIFRSHAAGPDVVFELIRVVCKGCVGENADDEFVAQFKEVAIRVLVPDDRRMLEYGMVVWDGAFPSRESKRCWLGCWEER